MLRVVSLTHVIIIATKGRITFVSSNFIPLVISTSLLGDLVERERNFLHDSAVISYRLIVG